MSLSRGHWIAALSVFLLAAALYFPSLRGGFVYDSIGQVLYTDYIHTPSHWGDVLSLRVLSRDELDRNRPLLLASLMLDASVWGREPFGYRLSGLLLHAANAAMLFWVIAAGLGRPPKPATVFPAVGAAIFAALFFALHPLVVEAVAEPSNREDELVLAAILFGLLVILRCGTHPQGSWLASNALLALAAFSAVTAKESGIAAVPVFVSGALLFAREDIRRLLPGLLLGGVLVTAFLLASYAWRPEPSVIFAVSPPPLAPDFSTALGLQCRIWAVQLLQIFCVAGLSADYPREAVTGIALPMALLVLALAAGISIMIARIHRIGLLGLMIFILALLPASNFAPQFHPMADRFLYVPLAGMAMMLGALAGWFLIRSVRPRARFCAVAVCIVLLVGLYAANLQRQRVWLNPAALWSDVLTKFPGRPIAYLGLANASYREGDFERAGQFAEDGVRSSGQRWDDLLAVDAMCKWKTGRRTEAVENFRLARALSPAYRGFVLPTLSLRWSREQLDTLRQIMAEADKQTHARQDLNLRPTD